LNELLARQFDRRPRIAVFGDSVIDEYYNVSSERVSPEFPIPVLVAEEDLPRICLGGSGNVCSQFSNFNFDVSLFSLINKEIFDIKNKVQMDGSVFVENVPIKKRYHNNGFPLCRMDVEGKNYKLDDNSLNASVEELLSNLKSNIFDVVIFSDYAKGVFNPKKEFIQHAGDSITIVDPKNDLIEKWHGCTIFKPNYKEALRFTGESNLRRQCEILIRKINCQAVVVTQEGEGVYGNVMGRWFEYRPNFKIKARSVVGAGDCFVAFLAMCMAHSIDIVHAVELAFDACSLYVQKEFNAPVHPCEIGPKIIDPRFLIERNFTLCFTNGAFDITHPGHISLLEFAKSKADKLVVALNSDASVVRQGKSHPLINNLDYRKKMISAIGCVDFVVDFDEDTPCELIKKIKPDVLVKGSDWKVPAGSEFVKNWFLFDIVGNYSTTSIIEKIRENV